MDVIIIGLGNNDKKLEGTKHNIGRVCVEALATYAKTSFSYLHPQNKKGVFYAKYTEVQDEGTYTVHLLYPDGYMNVCGESIYTYISFMNIDIKKAYIIVVHDDSDQVVGRHKVLVGGGTGGHNGLKSLFAYFDAPSCVRVKIGIRPYQCTLRSEAFVLSKYSREELHHAHDIAGVLYQHISLRVRHLSHFLTIMNSI